MKDNNKQYWKGLDELHREESFEKQRFNEFAEKLPLGEALSEDSLSLTSSRRDFLKFMGFSITAATLAACTKTPVKKVVPYAIKPQDVEPGVANFYATTCGGCDAKCSLIVKTREGRPIKIEGNPDSPINRGGVCAVGQGTVLSLYDTGRLDAPHAMGKKTTWEDLDKQVGSQLSSIAASGGSIRILTGTLNSPSTQNIINEFISKYPSAKHVSYDAVSSYAIRAAHEQAFGKAMIPTYKIEDATMLVSFGADFLGGWISASEYTKQYSAARKVDEKGNKMLYHIQFETTLSLSGSNADMRVPLSPSQYGEALVKLHNEVAGLAGRAQAGSAKLELMGNAIAATARNLWKHRGKSIIFSDSNNIDHQLVIASINEMLGNYGATIDIMNPSYQKTGNDKDMIALVNDMKAGNVHALIMHNVNPVYTYPDSKGFSEGLKKVKLSISMNDRMDETARETQFVAPDHHFLESWDDAMPRAGVVNLSQPTITPIFNTRAMQESMLIWAGKPMDYHDYIAQYWKSNFFGKTGTDFANFDDFWIKSVHDGFITVRNTDLLRVAPAYSGTASSAASRITSAADKGVEVVLYEKVGIRDGKHSNNPWLQEMPDPVTKVSWDNYLVVNPKWAAEKNLTDEDTVKVSANGVDVTLPILRQPGQRYNTVAIAFGYGRKVDESAGKVMNTVGGANAYPFARINGDTIDYANVVTVSGKTGTYPLALTQTHHHMEGRDLVRETTVAEMASNDGKKHGEGHHLISLWKDYHFPSHHWAMAIDLNACTGCNACVVACNAENNIPVVGKDEVRRRREMHWMRIDRYYGIADKKGVYHDEYKEIDHMVEENEEDYENVKVVFQPLTCQHCSNAPCESVCPVNAINHSSEGLNQQVYNRCVGTKYCANNCPYKVRRFNWFAYAKNDKFDYHMNNDLGRMVLNPDVVVRGKGVMEKCTFCVQRIQEGKLDAKKENRMMKDGDVKTACQQTCPANAIVFGDLNDPNSEVSKLAANKRAYGILEEINVKPNISYLSKVRSTPEQTA